MDSIGSKNNDEAKELNNEVALYLFLNSGAVNLLFWFMFMFGTHITSHKTCFFNDVIAPKIDNLYTISVLAGLLLLLIGFLMLKAAIPLRKKVSVAGVWISTISPLFVAIYYIILAVNKMADFPNFTVIPISLAVAYFNFSRGKLIIGK